jgi:uncharacterized repeat protein (TIGR01451 family)
MPKPVAIAQAFALAIFFVPFVGGSAANAATQYTLEGCRLTPGESLPNANGDFICKDADYTTGNLGKLWNELDLVPFRTTIDGGGSNAFVIAVDHADAGHPGYDVLSAPVINAALSDASCQVSSGAEQIQAPGQGGADETLYRVVTVTSDPGTTCVIDWYARLALGSHLYPGSSLHANLLSTNLDTAGIGSKEVSIPVKEILPQKIEKTMTATQGATYAWTLEKSATPGSVSFANTCLQSATPKSAPVTITLNWTRSAQTPSGDVLLTTHVTATNPAHRVITVNVTDKMYEGSTQTTLLNTGTGSFDVPAESSHTFDFTKTVSSSASTFNDVATATYTDKATNIAVPGTTTATATATVTSNGQVSGATAAIADVESITGSGFSFSVDSVSHGGDSADNGAFSGGYVLGTKASPVSWSAAIAPAGTGAASGSYTFAKTVYVAAGTVGSGTLSDTATLTPDGQDAISKTKSVSLSADAADPRLAITKTVDLAPTTDATFTFSVRAKDGQGNPTGPTYTFTVVIPAGQTSATSDFQTVAPSANGYVFTETAASGYTGVNGSIKALSKCDEFTATVNNTRDLGKIKIKKVLSGDPAGASTSFTAHVDCPGTAYDQDVALNAGNGWVNVTGDIPTGTQCTVSEPTVPAGWVLDHIDPADGVVTVAKGTPVEVTATITNKRLVGGVVINKLLEGDVAGASTEFTVDLNCDGTDYDHLGIVLNSGNSWTASFLNIPAGVKCTVTEPVGGIPAGWELKSISPSGEFTVGSGASVVVDVTNKRLVGSVTVNKLVEGDVAGASTEFTVLLDCDGTAYDQTVVLNSGNSWTQTFTNIPSGVKCTVTEPTVPAGWELTSISPSGEFTIGAGQTVTVNVTNKRLLGRITVAKNLVGAANGASTSFTFDVDCPGTAYDQSLVVNVINGSSASATTGLIPTGVSCTVTERSTPDWNQTSVVPAGGVVSVPGTVTFTNTRKQGVLNVSKAVSPVAGNGVVVNFGDTLTYTLTVSATGEATQHAVKVSDYIPGYDPARPTSGKTTYVAGSATCVGAGTCTVTGPDSAHLLTWALGDMAAGTTRQVTFKVTIDDVTGAAGETVAVDILNAGAVESRETPKKPSNQVITPVSKVLPVKVHKPPVVVLPHTGATLPVGPTVGGAIALLGLGLLLVAAGRRRPSWMPRR